MAGSARRDIHPSPQELEAFLRTALAPERTRAVVRHLAAGCGACRAALAPAVRALLERPSPDAYELPVRRALANAAAYAAALPVEAGLIAAFVAETLAGHRGSLPPETLPAARAWAWYERLLAEADAFRGSDPEAAVEAALLAVARARSLDPRAYGAETVADAQARAWGALGNALRAADDFEGADDAFVRAADAFERGSSDPRLHADLMNLLSSLRREQRNFDEAARLLDAAFGLYLSLGESHLAGRTLINKAMTVGYATQPEQAAALLLQGLHLLDQARDPGLVLAGVHNLAHCLLDCDRHAEAAHLLWRCRGLYAEHGAPLDLLRRRGLEGRAAAGLGEHERAERALAEAREGFADAGLGLDAAIVGLYLGALWLEQGRAEEVARLVDEMLLTFRRLKIGREAAAALLLLRRALAAGEATAALLRSTATDLQQHGRPPRRPAEPNA